MRALLETYRRPHLLSDTNIEEALAAANTALSRPEPSRALSSLLASARGRPLASARRPRPRPSAESTLAAHRPPLWPRRRGARRDGARRGGARRPAHPALLLADGRVAAGLRRRHAGQGGGTSRPAIPPRFESSSKSKKVNCIQGIVTSARLSRLLNVNVSPTLFTPSWLPGPRRLISPNVGTSFDSLR